MPQIIPQTIEGVQNAFSNLIKVLIEIFSQYGVAINSIIDVQGEYANITLSANQTANLSNDDHIEYDTIDTNGTLITLSTGAGQSDGKVTLSKGFVYKVTSMFVVTWSGFSASERLIAELRNNTDSVNSILINAALSPDIASGTPESNASSVINIIDASLKELEIEHRLASKIGTPTNISFNGTSLFIEVLR